MAEIVSIFQEHRVSSSIGTIAFWIQSVLFGYVVSFPFGTSRLLFFFLELKRSAVLSAFQLADVVRYLLQVEYFV